MQTIGMKCQTHFLEKKIRKNSFKKKLYAKIFTQHANLALMNTHKIGFCAEIRELLTEK